VTTKHDILLCGHLYPAGTLVEELKKDDPRVLAIFPDMQFRITSTLVAVRFLDRETATIGLKKSFTHYGERFTTKHRK